MSYTTIFSGKLDIQLAGSYLSELQKKVAEDFRRGNPIEVNGNSLVVEGEWADTGYMENIVLFIETHGKLIDGVIRCQGEDFKEDLWEIFISGGEPYIRETGTALTLDRANRRSKYAPNEKEPKLYRIG